MHLIYWADRTGIIGPYLYVSIKELVLSNGVILNVE
jgi:hypothetical protein